MVDSRPGIVLPAFLSVPRPNGSRALERAVEAVQAWLEALGAPVQSHDFTLRPYSMELLGLWLVLGGILLPLAALARSRRWQALTRWLFRSHLVTVGFDALISRTMADMSVCRNSTAIPLLSGRTNLSFFCTGGITWGRNRPDHLTSGWPWPQFQQAIQATACPQAATPDPDQGSSSRGAP